MSREMLISGGTIVNEGRRFVGWILIRGGVIFGVDEGEYINSEEFAGERIDASGKIVMPGVIDPHVHFREPGLTHKGDMMTESAAAAAGGVTSVLEMPNTIPPTTSREALARKMELAEGRMHTNYAFFLGAAVDNLLEIKRFEAEGGRLVKLFMGSSTGGMLVSDDRALAGLFAEFGGVIAAHCEDEDIIRSNTDIYRRKLGDGVTAAIHPSVRSEEACYRSTARAIELADRYGARLHVCHVTTARELALFSDSPLRWADAPLTGAEGPLTGAKKITAEACIPHLWFTDGDYARLGNLIKCNPAIKTAVDRDALRNALVINKIDLVATDHAPHTADEKARPYWEAPSGIPSIEYSLAVMMELASQGVVTLEGVVEKMCHAPAVRFGIAGRGFLREGYAADIAIVDPTAETVPTADNILSRCGWSPWEGHKFGSRVTTTIVGGRVVWDGTRVGSIACGQSLTFC